MRALLLAAAILMSCVVEGWGDEEPLMPDGVNQILGRVRAHMSESQLQKIVAEYYPDARVRVGRWSGQTGYADIKVTQRFSISIAEYNAPNDFESRFVHQDMTIYVYDWQAKRRVNISFHNWDANNKPDDKTSEQQGGGYSPPAARSSKPTP